MNHLKWETISENHLGEQNEAVRDEYAAKMMQEKLLPCDIELGPYIGDNCPTPTQILHFSVM